jgi:anti-anti-sigma factor
MKRHMTASTVGSGRRGATRQRTPFEKHSRTQGAARERHLALASASSWTHTLIATGELSHRTAHALEAEIDRLCDEGVTGITLDLRELTRIDSTGVAVVAFRAGLCERRGYEFTLIRGSHSVQRAFEQAGVADELPFRDESQEQDAITPSGTAAG